MQLKPNVDRPDPKTLGANCDKCPLMGKSLPVTTYSSASQSKASSAPQSPQSPLVVLIEHPTQRDSFDNRLLSGHSGELIGAAMEKTKEPFELNAATLCVVKKGTPTVDVVKAVECCRPRLSNDLKNATTVLALGNRAQQALTGKAKVADWMGYPLKGAAFRPNGNLWVPSRRNPTPPDDLVSFVHLEILSTHSPVELIANPALMPPVRKHIQRAVDLHRKNFKPFLWPKEFIEDNDETRQALSEILLSDTNVGVDLETDSLDHKGCTLLNVGIAGEKNAVSITWQTAPSDIKDLAVAILENPRIDKDFWNMQFDLGVLSAKGIVVNGSCDDWMLAKKILAPAIPNGLTFASCYEFNVPRWKTEFHIQSDHSGTAKFLKADWRERSIYNARDTYVTRAFREPYLKRLLSIPYGIQLYERSRRNTFIAMKMSKRGVALDTETRDKKKLLAKEQFASSTSEMIDIAKENGIENFNPQSHKQRLKFFISQKVDLPLSKSGTPTLDEQTLLSLIHLQTPSGKMAKAMLLSRKSKRRLDYLNALSGDRVYPTWRPNHAKTGRWASSHGLMLIPKPRKDDKDSGLRDCFRATDGHNLGECDYQALEAKILALLANDTTLIDWFNRKVDVHTKTASIALQKPEDQITKPEREGCKQIRYAFQYGSTVKTAYQQTVLKIPGLTLPLVERLFKTLEELHHPIVLYHQNIVKTARERDCVIDVLSGRAHHFHGQIDINQIYNLPIQMFASSLIDIAIGRINERFGAEHHLLMQIHDSLLFESADIGKAISIVVEEMERPVTVNGSTISFFVDCKIGENWGRMLPYDHKS